MKIDVVDFEAGAVFSIKADTEAERVLLMACTDGEGPLTEGDEVDYFNLKLEVSN